MKYFTVFFLFLSLNLAQGQSVNSDQIREEVKALTELFDLNDVQQQKAVQILDRKYADLEKLNSYRDTDPSFYRQKRRSLHEGTQGSILLILDAQNEAQMMAYKKWKKDQRIKRAQLVNKLKEQGADPEDIKDAKVGLGLT